MTGQDRLRRFTLPVVASAALVAGMLIAGAFNVTQQAAAERSGTPSAPTVMTGSPADFAALAEKVVPSVVSVFSTDVIQPGERSREMPTDPFEFFFGPGFRMPGQGNRDEPLVRQSAGSGFFISRDGELLTNNHVIEGADKIEIELDDGTRYPVKVVGRDPATDVALIRVEEPDRDFPVLPLGDSDAARVGEWVMAVGNPLNMDHTVTVGVISAKGRVLGLSDSSFENLIQTDAAINFGNSGGPLVNTMGQAIGINTAINAGGQNLGFAVPTSTAERVLAQLRQSGKVVRGYLGAAVRNVDPEIKEAFGLADRKGAFVESVEPKHAAAKAGLEPGDLIVAVDGQPVADTRELIDLVSSRQPGSRVRLEVLREHKQHQLEVVLEERPSSGPPESEEPTAEESSLDKVGITVEELTPRMRQVYNLDEDVRGVVISHVSAASPAGDEGLLVGDVISEANGKPVITPAELRREVEALDAGKYLRLYVYRARADQSFFVLLKFNG